MFFQEFSGINCILFYSAYIFQWTGIGWKGDTSEARDNAKASALSVSGTLFLFTILSCFLVDRVGRRKLLLFGSVAMSLALLSDGIIGCYFHGSTPTPLASKFSLFNTLLFIATYSIGWGPLPWLLMSELFPLKTRGVATSIVTCANWLFVFTTTLSYCAINHHVHLYGTFFIFMGVVMLGFVFVWLFLPETGGRPLEDVSELFLRRRLVQINIPWFRYTSLEG